jgi:hypothetical protein
VEGVYHIIVEPFVSLDVADPQRVSQVTEGTSGAGYDSRWRGAQQSAHDGSALLAVSICCFPELKDRMGGAEAPPAAVPDAGPR